MSIEKYKKIRDMYKPLSPCKQNSPIKKETELEASGHGLDWAKPGYTEAIVKPSTATGLDYMVEQAAKLSQRVKDAGGWKSYRAKKKQDRADAKAAAEAGMTVEEYKKSQATTDEETTEPTTEETTTEETTTEGTTQFDFGTPWGPEHPQYGTGELLKKPHYKGWAPFKMKGFSGFGNSPLQDGDHTSKEYLEDSEHFMRHNKEAMAKEEWVREFVETGKVPDYVSPEQYESLGDTEEGRNLLEQYKIDKNK